MKSKKNIRKLEMFGIFMFLTAKMLQNTVLSMHLKEFVQSNMVSMKS